MTRIYECFLLLVCGILFMAFMTHIPHQSNDVAAWVQAWGSVAAIVAATLISRSQYENDLKRDAAQRIDRLEVAKALGERVFDLLEEAIDSDGYEYYIGDESCIYDGREFRQVEEALTAFPLHDCPADTVVLILKLVAGAKSARLAVDRADQEMFDHQEVQYETDEWLVEVQSDIRESLGDIQKAIAAGRSSG